MYLLATGKIPSAGDICYKVSNGNDSHDAVEIISVSDEVYNMSDGYNATIQYELQYPILIGESGEYVYCSFENTYPYVIARVLTPDRDTPFYYNHTNTFGQTSNDITLTINGDPSSWQLIHVSPSIQ